HLALCMIDLIYVLTVNLCPYPTRRSSDLLVASNWGRNWRTDQPPGVNIPVQLFYGEFADNGVVQTVLASWDPGLEVVTPWREWRSEEHTSELQSRGHL